MKTLESGMPPEDHWAKFFDPPAILAKLNLSSKCGDVLEFGCGYGTFTIPAAQMILGTILALDIEQEMIACTRAKAVAAQLGNIELRCRDFVAEGSGLAAGVVGYVMLFNLLHAVEKHEMLEEAARVLTADGQLAIIHWNYDPTTPRGPSMSIRPRPSDCIAWAEAVGFCLSQDVIDLPPYHYGLLLRRKK